MSNEEQSKFREAIPDDSSLAEFLNGMKDFEGSFCKAMMDGVDFTIRIEVHGNKGEMLHCRVVDDSFRRPSGVEGRIERKKNSGKR